MSGTSSTGMQNDGMRPNRPAPSRFAKHFVFDFGRVLFNWQP